MEIGQLIFLDCVWGESVKEQANWAKKARDKKIQFPVVPFPNCNSSPDEIRYLVRSFLSFVLNTEIILIQSIRSLCLSG